MKKTFRSMDELPVILNAVQLSQALGISKAGAYNLLNSDGFPTVHIGTRLVVAKDKLVSWLDGHAGKGSEACS